MSKTGKAPPAKRKFEALTAVSAMMVVQGTTLIPAALSLASNSAFFFFRLLAERTAP